MWHAPAGAPRPVCAIDFEASRLPREGSFPIEAVIARADGWVRSWLIRPEASWLERDTRDPEDEAVHGLSRERLLAEGRAAAEVAVELVAEIADHVVISDHARSDALWLGDLCRTVGIRPPRLADLFRDVIYPWLEANGSGNPIEELD